MDKISSNDSLHLLTVAVGTLSSVIVVLSGVIMYLYRIHQSELRKINHNHTIEMAKLYDIILKSEAEHSGELKELYVGSIKTISECSTVISNNTKALDRVIDKNLV